MSIIAIVGAQENKWAPEQKEQAKIYIRGIIFNLYNTTTDNLIIISGHCPKGGVDIWVEEIVDNLISQHDYNKISMKMYPSSINKWSGKGGYKQRNTEMATDCDILYDIEPKGVWSGGTWTMKLAEKLGKETHKIEVE